MLSLEVRDVGSMDGGLTDGECECVGDKVTGGEEIFWGLLRDEDGCAWSRMLVTESGLEGPLSDEGPKDLAFSGPADRSTLLP